MVQSIFRKATADDRLDVDLMSRKRSLDKRYRDALRKVEAEHTENHTPFCYRGALLDFQDAYAQIERDKNRGLLRGFKAEEWLQKQIDKIPSYADPKLFELRRETIAKESKVMDGSRVMVEIGYHLWFYCERYDSKVTVFVPMDEYKKRKAKSQKS